jgi:hypothetical protein
MPRRPPWEMDELGGRLSPKTARFQARSEGGQQDSGAIISPRFPVSARNSGGTYAKSPSTLAS